MLVLFSYRKYSLFLQKFGGMGNVLFLNAPLPPCVLNYVTSISIYQNVTIE